MYYISKKRSSLVVLLTILFLMFNNVSLYAATIGQSLTAPESGWKRYDDSNSYFVYNGTWATLNTGSHAFYNGGITSTYQNSVTQDSIKFKFSGTKLRIIAQIYSTRSNNVQIKIDGVVVGSYSLYNASLSTDQCLVYEKTGLQQGDHYIELLNLNAAKTFIFDAIDIDSSGALLPYDELQNLQATPGDSTVTLQWDSVSNSIGYKVKRSATAGGPYEIIAENVTETTYIDTTVTNGTTYYYVVSAVTSGGESNNSNEVSATPSGPEISGNALLVITLVNGLEKEYDLTMEEVNAFISWYEDKEAGNGSSYYIISKNYNLGSFLNRKDYIVFDKITNFEVMQYQ